MKWHFVLLILGSVGSHYAYAQDVRRCVRADGTVVFTDRACAEQEQEKLPPSPASTFNKSSVLGTKPYIALPPSCNSSADELLYAVRSAIDMHDVNQLAKQYHWPGISDAQAELLMNRLEILANSTLIDIQLLYPTSAENEQHLSNTDTGSTSESDWEQIVSDTYAVPQKRRSNPYALRVSQYLSNTNSQTQTSSFRLQRHFDCWWIRY
jgi:hypothetical protein